MGQQIFCRSLHFVFISQLLELACKLLAHFGLLLNVFMSLVVLWTSVLHIAHIVCACVCVLRLFLSSVCGINAPRNAAMCQQTALKKKNTSRDGVNKVAIKI